MKKLDLRGVTVATSCPSTESCDRLDGYARILDYCACPDGIAAVFVNGHAARAMLSDEERHAVIERTRAHIGAKPLLAGIIARFDRGGHPAGKLAEAAGAVCRRAFPTRASRRRRIGNIACAGRIRARPLARRSIFRVHLPVSVSSGFGYSHKRWPRSRRSTRRRHQGGQRHHARL